MYGRVTPELYEPDCMWDLLLLRHLFSMKNMITKLDLPEKLRQSLTDRDCLRMARKSLFHSKGRNIWRRFEHSRCRNREHRRSPFRRRRSLGVHGKEKGGAVYLGYVAQWQQGNASRYSVVGGSMPIVLYFITRSTIQVSLGRGSALLVPLVQ